MTLLFGLHYNSEEVTLGQDLTQTVLHNVLGLGATKYIIGNPVFIPYPQYLLSESTGVRTNVGLPFLYP